MKKALILITIVAALASVASASVGTVINGNVGDVGIPNHWVEVNSPYILDGQVFVLPGETLTIDAGVVVTSFLTDDIGSEGTLAVTRGAQIFAEGTRNKPIIFTSAEDIATWAGSVVQRNEPAADANLYPDGYVSDINEMGNPKTGTWRARNNEWGSLAILGSGYISASRPGTPDAGNVKYPDVSVKSTMEGMIIDPNTEDPNWAKYGGDDDDDDSGSLSYVSFRYGGRETQIANSELNGLSLGGLGRETDIHHIDIMNNLDDGIEIWGGTVSLSYVNIWNIGDDSFDLDQGWRGTAQYGLIVQGYSSTKAKKQGSGFGDNCFEHDGAEDSDAQPMTTAVISNFTAVGNPIDGDQGTAWRDNARIQYADCIWMDIGDQLVKNDGDDGDGSNGYGHNGTLTFPETWDTDYTFIESNNTGGVDMNELYTAQTSGKLAQITGSIFYNIADVVTANDVGVFDVENNNTTMGSMPIQELTRGELEYIQPANKFVERVLYINPLPVASAEGAGGFNGCNWLAGWTAADAYGMTDTSMNGESADLNCDGIVDLFDLSGFSSQWLD